MDRRERWLLWLLTAAALALRTWGIAFGLPFVVEARPDERQIIQVATRMWSGDPNPHFFNYPTLFMYAQSAAIWIASAVARSAGHPIVPDGAAAHLIGRLTSALTGAATVPLLYWSARRLFSREVAAVAAAFLAVAFLHVRDSHFGVTDVPATFVALLAFAVMVSRPVEWAHRGNVLLAAALCGLAASTKYNVALIIAPLVILAVTQQWRARRALVPVAGLLAFIGAAALAGFLLGTPFAALDYPALRAAVTFERQHLAEGHGIVLGSGWVHHLTVSLWFGLGWPLLACALAGSIVLAAARRSQAAIVLAFPLIYYVVIGSGQTVFVRYVLPLVPFLCLLAAVTIVQVARALHRDEANRAVRAAALAVLAVAAGGLSAARSIAFDRTLAATDNRAVVAQWLDATFPNGATIYQIAGPYAKVPLPGRFREWVYDPSVDVMHAPVETLPEVAVVAASPLVTYTPVSDLANQVLSARYRLLARFDVGVDGYSGPVVYDEQDAFFVPLSGFGGVRRPGPSFDVFGRR